VAGTRGRLAEHLARVPERLLICFGPIVQFDVLARRHFRACIALALAILVRMGCSGAQRFHLGHLPVAQRAERKEFRVFLNEVVGGVRKLAL
jgi:hypothetical protein